MMALLPIIPSLRILSIAYLAILYTSTFVASQSIVIPSWKVQSSSKAGNDVANLSSTSLDTSTWYTIGSRGTLMATLLENNVYRESDLFFSDNLANPAKVDSSQFRVPWYYRADIQLNSTFGTQYYLKTHGITSRADIYLNGHQIADKIVQAGSYAGLSYNITYYVNARGPQPARNVLLVKVYPTDYNRDLAIGFVDWNPSPSDNGTGIWRDIEIKQTGRISLSSPRVVVTLPALQHQAQVSLRVDVQNLEDGGVRGEVVCTITSPSGQTLGTPRAEYTIPGKARQTLTLNHTITSPQLWWPKQWGAQPLYTTSCTATTSMSGLPDKTPPTKFGIRTVTSKLNDYNDTIFYVNNRPFQVIGAGYTSDIFLRFSPEKLRAQFSYALSMGLNTIRLEGKQEHPALYSLADELGLMLIAGWECCDKWEGWSYNDEGSGHKWVEADYTIANNSMRHEAEMMQTHPSMLAFLIGSDFWPDDKATKIYVDALKAFDWNIPIISSASQRGYPSLLGNSGMKMEGPYDWVPPSYWNAGKLGGAYGFASELGAGAGTPELNSLQKFLSPSDIEDLWRSPNKSLYHMSAPGSQFEDRKIYNSALWNRYGAPTSIEDYLLKAQMADYEATRAQFESWTSHWSAQHPATGMIYWMFNSAWPSLHWNLFDYYLKPSGAFFGAKTANRQEHVVYDYTTSSIWMVNRALDRAGMRTVEVEIIGLHGRLLGDWSALSGQIGPNESRFVTGLPVWGNIGSEGVALLKLTLHNRKEVLSRNVYWISSEQDELDWEGSTWYHTPTTNYADFTALQNMQPANLSISYTLPQPTNSTSNSSSLPSTNPHLKNTIFLHNTATVPAVFIRLNLEAARGNGNDILPVTWSDNYITLWPGEKMNVTVEYEAKHVGCSGCSLKVVVDGRNVGRQSVTVA